MRSLVFKLLGASDVLQKEFDERSNDHVSLDTVDSDWLVERGLDGETRPSPFACPVMKLDL